MIRIINISKRRPNEAHVPMRTNWGAGTAAFPILVDLAPGKYIDVPAQSVNDWDPGVKQWLAEYVVQGLLKVFNISSLHLYQDKNHNAEYDYDYLIEARMGDLALNHAIDVATSLNTEMQLHFDNLSVHGGAVGTLTAAVPTNLATLIAWITDAQTQHAAHLASAVAHTIADTWNPLALGAPTDLATSIAALQELYRRYHSHKSWLDPTSAAEMDVVTLLAY